ncbi:MAG TPA: hypothetical protein VJ733_11485 [Candidatus Binatia bacterium]|nr:hypothetical protein [Candidatus Binatia bacterium]
MPTADDIRDAIATSAIGPKSAQADGLNVQQHDLLDQIAAERHVAGQDAAAKAHRGLRFTKMIPAGPT